MHPESADHPGYVELNNKGGLRETLKAAAARGRRVAA